MFLTHLPRVFCLVTFLQVGGLVACNSETSSTGIQDEVIDSLDTISVREAATAANPGYRIAYTDDSRIWMMSPDATDRIELADGSPAAGYVSWSPDARYVYFLSARGSAENTGSIGNAWEAFRVNVTTRELQKLSGFGQDVRGIAISLDGRYLALSVMNGSSTIGNNNDNLTQFHTDLFLADMAVAESLWNNNQVLTMEHLRPLVSSPASSEFRYEELSWRPDPMGIRLEPMLAYSKTWRYDDDINSYTHSYVILADGTELTKIADHQDMPVWDFTGDRLSFLDPGYYDFTTAEIRSVQIDGLDGEISTPSFSPHGNYVVFEVGDNNRKGGIARLDSSNRGTGELLGNFEFYEPRWSPQPVM